MVTPDTPVGKPHTSRFTLRDYQHDAVDAVLAARRDGRTRVLLVLPPGAGKTVIFSEIVARVLGGARALILVHRDELLTQAEAKLRDVLGDDAPLGIVKAERNDVDARIVVASVQTLSRPNRLPQLGGDFAMVVVDEAHHAPAASYRTILDYLGRADPAPFVLGVTATADRGDGVGLGDVFETIVYDKPMLDLMAAGHLVDIIAKQIALKADFNRLHTRAGDFIDGETGEALLSADAPNDIARAYRQLAPDRKGIVFTPTVAVAEAMAAAFADHGIPARSLAGTTPTHDRHRILADLRSGATQVVTNCAVLTEGFDEPSVSCVAIAKPTKSRGHYTQMLGRGTRPFPGKTDLLVLDAVGATTRHDLMTAAGLFGLPVAALATRTVAEAVADKRAAQIPVSPGGALVAATVDLFRRRAAHWVPTRTGRFVLSTGDGMLVLRPGFGDRWDVLHVPRPGQGPPSTVTSGMTLPGAQGFAEGRAIQMGAGALVDRNAPWRLAPPSDKQVFLLRRLGVPITGIQTRGDAADAISAAQAAEVA